MDSMEPSANEIFRHEYCLYCYAPLHTLNASQRCARCGRVHVRADQAAYWTKEPTIVRVERVLKFGVVLLMVGVFSVFWFDIDLGHERLKTFHLGRVNTFLIGPLLMLGGLLWWTAGFITRKPRYFSPSVLWISVFLMLALGTPVLLFILDVAARHSSFGAEYWEAYLVLASPAIPMPFLGLALFLLSRKYEVFKKQRVDRGAW